MTRKALGWILGAVVALALVCAVPGVRASDLDEATLITFRRPVRIPGNKTLPAGAYLFKTISSFANDNGKGVRIFNADGTAIYATLHTRDTSRRDTSVATQLSFAQSESQKQPDVLLTWFYPDSLTGHQFVYSNRETSRIAKEKRVTVMATPGSGTVTSSVSGARIVQ